MLALTSPFDRMNMGSLRPQLRPTCHSRKRSTSSSKGSLKKMRRQGSEPSLIFMPPKNPLMKSPIVHKFQAKRHRPRTSEKKLVKTVKLREGNFYDSCESAESPRMTTQDRFSKIQLLIEQLRDEENPLEVSFGHKDSSINNIFIL